MSASAAASATPAASLTYIMVSGAREWAEKDYDRIAAYFAKKAGEGKFILIEGECRGVDLQARRAAEQLGMQVLACPAEWGKYGRAAGPKRNIEMVDLLAAKRKEGYPTIMVYFHDNLEASKGTKHAVAYAKKQGFEPVNGGESAK